MAVLLVGLTLMGLLMSMALPVWSQQARREREAELIFRGEQYARAIALYQRQQPGAFPDDLDALVEQRYLRRKYRDPMTADGAFRILRQSDQEVASVGGAAGEIGSDSPSGSGSGRLRGAGAEARRRGGDDRGGVEGGIIGVVSRSSEPSLRIYNGRQRYDEWEFTVEAAGGDAAGEPSQGGRGRRGSGDLLGGAGAPGGFGAPGRTRAGPGR